MFGEFVDCGVDKDLCARDDIMLPIGGNLYALLVRELLDNAVETCVGVAEPAIRVSVRENGGSRRKLVTTVTDTRFHTFD